MTSVECNAGDKKMKDDVLCTIEVPDQGYTLSFTATNEQASRLRIGDQATVSNFYWGNEVTATLSSIKTDPKNPQNNKLLTFDLEGNVTSGSQLTISVGSKSANYDLIIPSSAIRSDSNGSFVLKVEAKNSPLGNRYIAKRVPVEVLDRRAAVRRLCHHDQQCPHQERLHGAACQRVIRIIHGTEEEKTDQQAAEHSAACLYCHAACRCGLLRRMVVAFPPAGVPAGGRALAG